VKDVGVSREKTQKSHNDFGTGRSRWRCCFCLGCAFCGRSKALSKRNTGKKEAAIDDRRFLNAWECLSRGHSIEQEDAEKIERKARAGHELDRWRTASPFGDSRSVIATITDSPCPPPFSPFPPVPSVFFRVRACLKTPERCDRIGERARRAEHFRASRRKQPFGEFASAIRKPLPGWQGQHARRARSPFNYIIPASI
jgi:hypothetical protein